MSRYRRGGSWPYNTPRWKLYRAELIAERGGCEECGRDHGRLDIHHVDRLTKEDRESRIEAKAFPALGRLRVLCISCHSMLTRGIPEQERNRRLAWRQFIDGGLA